VVVVVEITIKLSQVMAVLVQGEMEIVIGEQQVQEQQVKEMMVEMVGMVHTLEAEVAVKVLSVEQEQAKLLQEQAVSEEQMIIELAQM
jgi:hypothetical protein